MGRSSIYQLNICTITSFHCVKSIVFLCNGYDPSLCSLWRNSWLAIDLVNCAPAFNVPYLCIVSDKLVKWSDTWKLAFNRHYMLAVLDSDNHLLYGYDQGVKTPKSRLMNAQRDRWVLTSRDIFFHAHIYVHSPVPRKTVKFNPGLTIKILSEILLSIRNM